MNTPLTQSNLTEAELSAVDSSTEEEQLEEEEAHIHLPGPSLWPALLSVAILLVFAGLVMLGNSQLQQATSGIAPWFIFIGLPCVLIGIMGWALEDPNAHAHANGAHGKGNRYAVSFADAATTGKPTVFAEQVLDQAEGVVEDTVTISSTAWSAHPVKVYVEREGVVLSLYGKVELEAQKQEVEAALRKVPGVLDVMNFLVAEDELLTSVNAAIDKLKAAGKLDGATDLDVLVENGIVSLYGNVPDTSMKYLLERELASVPGARVVINHIGLNKDIPGNLGKTINR